MKTENNTTANHEKLFDLSMIEKICRGNNDALTKMISTFISHIPLSVEEIKKAYREKDLETVNKTAHRIKPVLAIYAIVKIEREIRLLEKLSPEAMSKADTGLIINKLDQVVNSVALQMKKEFLLN
jgi:HPt (histidine-containing phosphotransfer) domain-containing protein